MSMAQVMEAYFNANLLAASEKMLSYVIPMVGFDLICFHSHRSKNTL